MYRCVYCDIFLKKGIGKVAEEHELGYRHKTNKYPFFKKIYYSWIEKNDMNEN